MSVTSWCFTCFCVALCVSFCKGHCHCALKFDISTLFTTFFLWTSLQFILNVLDWHFVLVPQYETAHYVFPAVYHHPPRAKTAAYRTGNWRNDNPFGEHLKWCYVGHKVGIYVRHNIQHHLGLSENWILCLSLVTNTSNVWNNAFFHNCRSFGHHFKYSVYIHVYITGKCKLLCDNNRKKLYLCLYVCPIMSHTILLSL